MLKRKHLFVTLSKSGWGETTLGIDVARQVCQAGGTVSFIAHSGSMPAFSGTNFEVQKITKSTGKLLGLVFDDCIARNNFASIILSDFLTTNYTMIDLGVDPEFLLRYGLPVIPLDTWEYDVTGPTVDVFGYKAWSIGKWIEKLPQRLVPVPIGRPTTSGAYCSLPAPGKLTPGAKAYLRRNLGLNDGEKAVLFCTAGWQQGLDHPAARQMLTALPQLLWSYLAQMDAPVRLIHVGPARLSINSENERYLWMPPLSPREFEMLLCSMDMVLSANVSATTIGRAIAAGVPVMVVQNSHMAASVEEVTAKAKNPISSNVRTWLHTALPLYPFSMWPLGFFHFLNPLLMDNPYCSAIDLVELVDEARFTQVCCGVLFDSNVRAAAVEHQAAYAQQVRQLPTAAQLIDRYLQ